jgi:hypothetical protein
VNKNRMGGCRACAREEGAMARTALCSGDTKTGIQKKEEITRYDIFELEGEERRADKRRT